MFFDKSSQPLKIAYVFLFFAVSAWLAFANLGGAAFWDDEAQVAIIARNYLHAGHITGWDGRNLYGYCDGVLLDRDLRIINPPLDYLITAASFRVFGESTWAARLPFVLCGLASLLVLWLLLRQEFGRESAISLYVFGLMSLSTVFLLNIRNCRYYAPALLFSLLAYYAYRRALKNPGPAPFVLLAAAFILLFFSNFLLCAAFLMALCFIQACLHSRETPNRQWWKNFGLAAGIFLAGTLPYAIRFQVWRRQDFTPSGPWYLTKPVSIVKHLQELNQMGALPWVVALGLLYFLARRLANPPARKMALEWALLTVAYAVSLSLLLPTVIPDLRYLIPVLPFLTGLTGIFLGILHERSRHLAAVAFAVVISCNILAINPLKMAFQWNLPDYMREITHPYPTANAAVSEFLNGNAAQDDLVFATPEYINYPLMFYSGGKVRFCGLLDERTHLPHETLDKLPAYLFKERIFPDRIILFGLKQDKSAFDSDRAGVIPFYSRPHVVQGKSIRFTYRLEKTVDTYWDQTNRPELPWHHFGAVTDFNRKDDAVYIYKRDQ